MGRVQSSVLSRVKAGLFNSSWRGGPARMVVIAGVGAAMVVTVVVVSMRSEAVPLESTVASMPAIDPLPGGMHSNKAQDALLLRHAQDRAAEAEKSQASYTPPIPASRLMKARPALDPAIAEPVEPEIVEARRPEVVSVVPVVPPPPAYVPHEVPLIHRVAATGPVEVDPNVKLAVDQLMRGFEGRPPRTDIVLMPGDRGLGDAPREMSNPGVGAARGDDRGDATGAAAPAGKAQAAPAAPAAPAGRVLVPAGRGIYAHTVLAVDSDTNGPIVLEADSAPLAGDRMIGSFSKNGAERLVVRVNSIEHRGKTIDASGLVIAPDTMQTSVASSVEPHYFERFVMPAAAAFVQGLGQAIVAGNSTLVTTPFGGTISYYDRLDLQQQQAVAAGASAREVGTELKLATPKGPTIHLAANVNVGVMFLSNVVEAK